MRRLVWLVHRGQTAGAVAKECTGAAACVRLQVDWSGTAAAWCVSLAELELTEEMMNHPWSSFIVS